MSKKNEQQILLNKETLETNKAKLEAIKADYPEKWNQQMQVKLDEIIGELADIEDELDAYKESETTEAAYEPTKGTEKLVHASIAKGRRFNPSTGEEETKSHIQMFTYAEWLLFKKNHKRLGYVITEILHNPYDKK